MNDLFPANFLAGISRLSLRVRTVPTRPVAGMHLSRAPGASLEFRDYQSYTPGDDLRGVDWTVYARTRHLFVRRFDQPTAVPVFLLVDASSSMLLEDGPTRYATAARVAASIATAAVGSQNPICVAVTHQNLPTPLSSYTGRAGLLRVLADLSMQRKGGAAGISQAIAALAPSLASRGTGVLVVISDFFDDRGVQAVIDALRSVPGRMVLVPITRPTDEMPELHDDFELTDSETGATLHVSPSADVLKRYRDSYTAYFRTLENYARGCGWPLVRFDAESDTLSQLPILFPRGILSL